MPVYFIQAGEGGPVKIGYASNVKRRLKQMRGSNHEELRLLRIMDGDTYIERRLHVRFEAHRKRGEWFWFVPEMLTISAADVRPEWTPRSPEVAAILSEVEDFCRATGTTEREFGLSVNRDGRFLRLARDRKRFRPQTIERIRSAMTPEPAR